MSTQWEPYDNTAYVPGPGDIEFENVGTTGPSAPLPDGYFDPGSPPPSPQTPPSNRQYGFERQEPTWQHASLQGIDVTKEKKWTLDAQAVENATKSIAAIAAAAALGYYLTGSTKVGAGAGLGMLGLNHIFTFITGSWFRPVVGIACLAGSYYLLKDSLQFSPNEDSYEDDDSDQEEDEIENED